MEVDSCMGYYLSPTLSYLPARSFSNCHPPPVQGYPKGGCPASGYSSPLEGVTRIASTHIMGEMHHGAFTITVNI